MKRQIKFRGKRVDTGEMVFGMNATQRFRRTPKGVLTNIYSKQVSRSKTKGVAIPDYSLSEFQQVFLNDVKFLRLFKEWVDKGYSKDKKPSFDRIDCRKPYTLSNIHVLTFEENRYKQRMETNVFRATKIGSFDKDHNLIAKYKSVSDAVKSTGYSQGSISSCLTGIKKTYKGLVWEYLETPKRKIKDKEVRRCIRCENPFTPTCNTQNYCSVRCSCYGNKNAIKNKFIHDNPELLKGGKECKY